MNKPFFTANVRDILDLHTSGEISFSMMVELFNSVASESQEQECRVEVSKVMCVLCGNNWITVKPEGVNKLECGHCKIISTVKRVR